MNVNEWRTQKNSVVVGGRKIAYVEAGDGDPIVFQHGNPTSSYLWRNILPQLVGHGRCIAIDLIGMGDSDKLPDSDATRYTLHEHQQYWDGALAALGVERNVTFVLHDWGTAIGFDWCRRHPKAVARVCYMEGIVQRLNWDEWPGGASEFFRMIRSPAGEEAVLTKNVFIESVFPGAILRTLSEEEMDAYRAPFLDAGEVRRPILTWPRQLPLAKEPAEVCATVDAYAAYMKGADFPKLFIVGNPGMIMNGSPTAFARTWKNQHEVTVSGLHYLQEDSPDEIAGAIRAWLER